MSGLDSVVAALEASYAADERGQRVGKARLPSRAIVLDVVDLVFQLLYPGYRGRQDLTREELGLHTGTLLAALHFKLAAQIDACLANGADGGDPRRAHELAGAIVAKLPAIREMLFEDVQAAYDGDPAATSFDEIVLAYPGLVAGSVVGGGVFITKSVPPRSRVTQPHGAGTAGELSVRTLRP